MIDELTDPSDPKDPAFHVVAPSCVWVVNLVQRIIHVCHVYARLPGFVFSERASTPGMDVIGTAFIFDKLMIKLGFEYYLAQGGDW
jgi:hypothetical protein